MINRGATTYLTIIVGEIFSLLFCLSVFAKSIEQQYIDERDRISNLPFNERLSAFEKSKVFDRQSILGKYFILSTYQWTTEESTFNGLQGVLREQLKQQHPFFYVEMLINEIDDESNNVGTLYDEIIDEAKKHGYFDLARLAAMYSSNVLFSQGKLVDAIQAYHPVIQLPNSPSLYKGVVDVSVNDIFYSLANAYMLLGEFETAREYCVRSAIDSSSLNKRYILSKLCEANVNYYANLPNKTLDIIYPLLESKQLIRSYEVLLSLYFFLARANNQLGLYEDALEYAHIALELNDEPNIVSPTLNLIYAELIKSYVGLKDPKNSAHYAETLDSNMKRHKNLPFIYRKFLDAKSLNQELQGDFQGAYATLNEILEIDKELKRLNANKSSVIDTISGLSNTRVKYIETTAANAKTHQFQRNIAITLSFGFCIFCLFVYWRNQHKLQTLANTIKRDASTGLFSYGYSLLALANAQDASSLTPTSLVLVRLNNLTLLAKQKSVNHVKQSVIELAKYLNSALPDTFTIGRYSQDTFIIVLPKTFIVEAEHVIRDILKPYCNESLIEDNIVSVSAAILEITSQDAIEHVLIQCEDLLTQNPSTGEVIVKTSKYSAKPTNEAAA